MKATKFQSALITAKSALVTLWISVINIYRVRRGLYRREECDALLRWWSQKLLKFSDLSHEVHDPHGFQPAKDRAHIIMINHSSMYDIPLTFVSMPGSIRMLAKKELFQVPLWGTAMRVGEFVSIDRHNRRQAFKDLEEARKKMESGIILWVAPEGTRSRSGKLQPFKKGGFVLALQTKAIIVPVGIRGAFDVLPPGTLNFNTGRRLEFHVGRPIDASQFSRKSMDDLMERVREEMKELAAIPDETESEQA